MFLLSYRGILEKGSDDIRSAVCYAIYAIYLFLWTQTAAPISSKPISRIRSPVSYLVAIIAKVTSKSTELHNTC